MTPFEEMRLYSPNWNSEAEAVFQAVKTALDEAQFQALAILFECATFGSDGFQTASLDRINFESPDEAALFDRCLVELGAFGLISIRKRSRCAAMLDWPEKGPVRNLRRREKAALALAAIRRGGAAVH